MLAARGDAAGADALLRRAVEGFDAIGAAFEAAVARQALAEVLGDAAEAERLRAEADQAFTAAGVVDAAAVDRRQQSAV